MKKFFKRLFIILLVFLLVLVGVTAILASLFEDKVGQRLTAELNKQLTSELVINDFDLTVIRSFPNVAANLRGITLMDSRGGALLEAEELSFRFGLFSLLSNKIKIRSVVASNGALNIEIDKAGNPNYDIFVDSGEVEDKDDNGVGVSLELARLRNIELIYSDKSTRQDIAALVEDASFSGEFSSDQFSLQSDAQLISRFADLDGQRYLPGKAIDYDARILVNLKEGSYSLEEVSLDIEGNTFRIDGTIESWESGTYFDLFANSDDGNLEGVLNLLPAQLLDNLYGVKSSGTFVFNAFIKGQYNEQQNPEIRVEFSLEDGELSSPNLNRPLKDVSLNAVFSNGKFRDNSSSVFTLEEFKGYFNRELVEMKLEVANFDAPEVDFYLNGVMPMNSAYSLLGNPKITGGEGEIEFKEVRLNGRYADMASTRGISRVKASGALEFDDAGLSVGEEKIVFDRGELRLDGNRLSVSDLRLEGAGSDITFQGEAFNIVPVLFADSVNSQHVELIFEAALLAKNIDLGRLLQFSALTPEEKEETVVVQDSLMAAKVQQRENFTSFLKGTFNVDIDNLKYEKIETRNFKGKLEFDNSVMDLRGQVEAMGGRFELDGQAFFEEEPQLKARLQTQRVNATEFFRQTDNFGQEVLQSENIKGELDALIAIYAYWDANGNFLMDKLRVLAGIAIKDGALNNLEMLESFSTFVKIKDLKQITFVDMQNFLEVRHQRIYLPAMFIRSNALNLTISGEHSFSNDIDYNIKVNAGQVLADRFKRYDPSLKPKQARRSGWFNLYYTIAGNLDDYQIKSSKRQVKADFERSEIRKRDIQRALEQEFGIVRLIEEPEDWKDIPEFNHSTYDPEEEQYLEFDMEGGEQ